MKSFVMHSVVGIAVMFGVATAKAEEKPTKVESPPAAEVAKLLQDGGYVIYIRVMRKPTGLNQIKTIRIWPIVLLKEI